MIRKVIRHIRYKMLPVVYEDKAEEKITYTIPKDEWAKIVKANREWVEQKKGKKDAD